MKYQAKNKGRKWELSDEDALSLINDNCFYCGEKNETSCNSIDRLDSNLDYTLDNCETSCTLCNYMKNTLKFENFLIIIENICAYNKFNPTAKTTNLSLYRVSNNYKKYIDSAKQRLYDFKLSEDEFNEIIRYPCYICGIMNKYNKHNNIIHRNGIDRYDNTLGYIKDNCRSCCSMCNYLKRDSPYDKFMDKIKRIYEYRCIPFNCQKAYDEKIQELDDKLDDELDDELDNDLDDELDEKLDNKLDDNLLSNLDNKLDDKLDNKLDDKLYNKLDDKLDDKLDLEQKITNNLLIDKKREYNRLQKQLYRQRQRKNMGDEAYKKMRAEEKSRERNNGLIIENKHKKTEEEIKEAKRIRIALQRQQMQEKYGNEEYRKMMATNRAINRAKKQ